MVTLVVKILESKERELSNLIKKLDPFFKFTTNQKVMLYLAEFGLIIHQQHMAQVLNIHHKSIQKAIYDFNKFGILEKRYNVYGTRGEFTLAIQKFLEFVKESANYKIDLSNFRIFEENILKDTTHTT